MIMVKWSLEPKDLFGHKKTTICWVLNVTFCNPGWLPHIVLYSTIVINSPLSKIFQEGQSIIIKDSVVRNAVLRRTASRRCNLYTNMYPWVSRPFENSLPGSLSSAFPLALLSLALAFCHVHTPRGSGRSSARKRGAALITSDFGARIHDCLRVALAWTPIPVGKFIFTLPNPHPSTKPCRDL